MACTLLQLVSFAVQWCQSLRIEHQNACGESREFRTEEAAQGETAHVSTRSIAKTLPDVAEPHSPEAKRKKAALLDRGSDQENGAPPVPKSRRTSLGGIHRQASVCLSDEEEETSFTITPVPTTSQADDSSKQQQAPSEDVAPAPEDREAPVIETRQVAAEVHWNGGNSHTVTVVHDLDRTSTGSINSHNHSSGRMSLSSYSHSSPDTNSIRTVLICPEYLSRRRSEPDPKTSRFIVVASSLSDAHERKKSELFKLRKGGQRILDLEEYHYASSKKQPPSLLVPKSASPFKEKAMSMHDLPVQGEGWLEVPLPLRETESVEGGCLERGLEIHQKRYSKSFLQRTPVYDDDEEPPSKVRYNDMGSREEVNEEVLEFSPIESDELEEMLKKGEEEQLRQQYRELWQLRATLEEEEQGAVGGEAETSEAVCEEGCSATMTLSVDQYAELDLEPPTSYTTSFESSTEQGPPEDSSDPQADGESRSSNHHLQLPSYESRRHNYKSLLNKRLQGRGLEYKPVGSAETSLDSLETEWSSTERTEGITTSIESTTDNTDSTGEGQNNNHKLQQMKADSGYKSMEGSSVKTPAKVAKVQIQSNTGDADDGIELSVDEPEKDKKSEGGSSSSLHKELSHVQETIASLKELCKRSRQKVTGVIVPQSRSSGSVVMADEEERKAYKSALKKRRQYGKDRQSAALSQDSVHQGGESITESTSMGDDYPMDLRGKSSVFHRFFRSGSRPRFERTMVRDYSIDEKSDALFRQFLRQDPAYEVEDYRSRSPRFHGPMRLHHHYRGIDPESGSPRLRCKVISPRLSIEEEDDRSVVEEHQDTRTGSGSAKESSSKLATDDSISQEPSTSTEIPIIRLPVGSE